MTFPIINHIDDLTKHVKHKPEIRFRDEDHNTTVVCYMISGDDTFNDEWSRECRGITFCNDTGKVIMRTMHKFFNMGERESTRRENLPWGQVTQIMDKRDGSMISGCFHNGEILIKTKKSFTSEVALMAKEFIETDFDDRTSPRNYKGFIAECTGYGWTPSFEYTTPKQRIVLPYEADELVLLHVRDNVTGEYIPYSGMTTDTVHGGMYDMDRVFNELSRLITEFVIPVVETKKIVHSNPDIDALVNFLNTAEGIEGSIIQFHDGDMVKLKTPWYLKLHRAVTFVRERDIARLVLDETLDDVKNAMAELNVNIDGILAVEKRVVERLTGIVDDTELLAASDPELSMKEWVLKHRDNVYFHLACRAKNGGLPPYYDYFYRNILKQEFGLAHVAETPLGDDEVDQLEDVDSWSNR